MKKLSFQAKVFGAIILTSMLCMGASMVLSTLHTSREAHKALHDKASAILSRLAAAQKYVAEQNILKSTIDEAISKHPDGNLSPEMHDKILRSVPVYAALKVGMEGADKEHYQFRVFSDQPRRPSNMATPAEAAMLQRFRANPDLKEIAEDSADGKTYLVTRPVALSQAQGCLMCHGSPDTSPWKNGKDVLGFPMENMKDGEIKAAYTISSDLGPMKADIMEGFWSLLGWGFLFTLVAIGVAYLIVRNSMATLMRVSDRLAASSEELSSASTQVSSVSQELSAQSAEAASSLEETVASVEQLTSMVNKNADNAREASGLSASTKSSAENGEAEMKNLTTAIADISSSSKKIEEIINVIDDIAFQTNLLALNAAVEAARAGEQGKGFAVVAEAVRNLAGRSASAAKDISNLIKDSVVKVENGSKMALQSSQVLGEIVEKVKKVSEINGEISSASGEQAQGIAQISTAMNQLDQATQQNAAASQEAAAAAEELSSQAVALDQLVQDLRSVMGADAQGNGTTSGGAAAKKIPLKTKAEVKTGSAANVVTMMHKSIKAPAPKAASDRRVNTLVEKSVASKAQDILPMTDEEDAQYGKVGTTDGF